MRIRRPAGSLVRVDGDDRVHRRFHERRDPGVGCGAQSRLLSDAGQEHDAAADGPGHGPDGENAVDHSGAERDDAAGDSKYPATTSALRAPRTQLAREGRGTAGRAPAAPCTSCARARGVGPARAHTTAAQRHAHHARGEIAAAGELTPVRAGCRVQYFRTCVSLSQPSAPCSSICHLSRRSRSSRQPLASIRTRRSRA